MASDEDLTHLRELLDIYQRRRDELEVQRAHYGRGRVPADVTLDMQEVEESIKRIRAKLLAFSIPQEVQDATGPEAGLDVLREHVRHLGDQINTAMRLWTAEIIAMREETAVYRHEQQGKYHAGRRIQIALLILDAILLIVVLWRL